MKFDFESCKHIFNRRIKSIMKAADTSTPQEINTTCKKPDFFTLEEIQKILK